MDSFHDHWVKKNLPEVAQMPPMFPMYGIGESVMYGGFRYAVTDFSLNEKDNCWEYDLVRLDGTDEKANGILEPGLCKSQAFAKPGASIHTKKWDDCVEHVKANSSGANAYAVCTAMFGDDSFKAMDDAGFLAKVDEYIDRLGITAGIKAKSVGIGFAGPVPGSLLARQDLEGRKASSSEYDLEMSNERRQGQNDGAKYASVRKSEDSASTVNETATKYADAAVAGFIPHEDIISEMMSLHGLDYMMASDILASVLARVGKSSTEKLAKDSTVYVCFTDSEGMEQERAFPVKGDADAFCEVIKPLGYTNVRVEFGKGAVEEAKKDLIEMAESDKDTNKTDLAANIKAVQLKGQKATIAAREAAGEAKGKSFKDAWRGATE